jgi:MerR family transcriptional regulator/heat shock protein HspR
MTGFPEHDVNQPKYSITTVVELTGIHPQQLRRWEKAGILSPARSAKGTRRYSDADVQRIRQILALAEAGVNQAGIEQVLQLRQALAHAEERAQALEARLTQTSDAESPR